MATLKSENFSSRLKMPKRSKRVKFSGRSAKKKKRKVRKRPYKGDRHAHAKRRYAKRHPTIAARMEEAETANYLLHQLLKTISSKESDPYKYHPRDPTKDPEYKFSDARLKAFKDDFPAPDVNFWRPQGQGRPPYVGNFPDHRYRHPHEGI